LKYVHATAKGFLIQINDWNKHFSNLLEKIVGSPISYFMFNVILLYIYIYTPNKVFIFILGNVNN
jgi:hypothetical protein